MDRCYLKNISFSSKIVSFWIETLISNQELGLPLICIKTNPSSNLSLALWLVGSGQTFMGATWFVIMASLTLTLSSIIRITWWRPESCHWPGAHNGLLHWPIKKQWTCHVLFFFTQIVQYFYHVLWFWWYNCTFITVRELRELRGRRHDVKYTFKMSYNWNWHHCPQLEQLKKRQFFYQF